jgi:hypothetical protein
MQMLNRFAFNTLRTGSRAAGENSPPAEPSNYVPSGSDSFITADGNTFTVRE